MSILSLELQRKPPRGQDHWESEQETQGGRDGAGLGGGQPPEHSWARSPSTPTLASPSRALQGRLLGVRNSRVIPADGAAFISLPRLQEPPQIQSLAMRPFSARPYLTFPPTVSSHSRFPFPIPTISFSTQLLLPYAGPSCTLLDV